MYVVYRVLDPVPVWLLLASPGQARCGQRLRSVD